MKLVKFIVYSTGVFASKEGSGEIDTASNEFGHDSEDMVGIQHRSMFEGSPFAAIFAALDEENKEKKKPKSEPNVLEAVADEADYEGNEEGGEEYEGDLEGFDIEDYRESEAVNRVLNNALIAEGFQRGNNNGFGNINGGPDAPGVAKATANRVEVLMKMIMYLQVDPSFDKFFQYGCFCFPDGEKSVVGGYGEARDGADLVKTLHYIEHTIFFYFLLGLSKWRPNTEVSIPHE